MNEYEKKLALSKNEDIPKEELKRIERLTADVKRLSELLTMIPGAHKEFSKNSKEFIEKNNLLLDPWEMRWIFLERDVEKRMALLKREDVLDLIPESFFRFRQFCINKLYFRDYYMNTACVPKNERMKVWRDRQMKRCDLALGGVNRSFIHAPLTIELAKGCSVGCDFCGLNAEKLTGLYRYNEENGRLFKEVLKVCHEVIGDAAGTGMLYFASEALDNPDYEAFENDFYEEFKLNPQITTAVPLRDPERMKRLIAEYDKRVGLIHRFTLCSLEEAKKVFESYSPLELLRVELIPQYPDAPSFSSYIHAGRVLLEDLKNKRVANDVQGTICCVDGFCINFCEKSLYLLTPCHASEKYIRGIAETEKRYFKDAEEFKAILKEFIEEYMPLEFSADEILKAYPYVEYIEEEKSFSNAETGVKIKVGGLPDFTKPLIDLLKEGRYKKSEIARELVEKSGRSYEEVYWLLSELWKQGVISETIFEEK